MNSDARSSNRLDEDDGLLERAGGRAGLGLEVAKVLVAIVPLQPDVVSADKVVAGLAGGDFGTLVAALQS